MDTRPIALKDIVFDEGTQVRAAINQDVVAEYAGRMATGETFPAIVLFNDGNRYYLADGFHRVMAAHRNEWMSIRAEVRAGTKTDALWFALGANKANGQRMTTADKRHAILLAIKTWPDKGPTLIAEQIGCTDRWVREIRSEVTSDLPEKTIGKDGKSYSASHSTARHPKADEVEAALKAGERIHDISKSTGVSTRTVTAIGKAAGIDRGPDKSKASVAQRRKDVSAMAARGFTTRQIAQHIGIAATGVAKIAKQEGIVIHADRVVGKTVRHDANRIVEQMAMDAENLTADVDLIDFEEIDVEKLGGWIQSFKQSQKALGEFVKRLIKEQSKHGKAA